MGNARVEQMMQVMETDLRGKSDKIEMVVQAFLAGGHVLIEDIPGVGKTTLAKSMARVSGLDFKRIQFTPDLMPSDVTGVSVYDFQNQQFQFKSGPVFTHVLLADEINRATPKTQSALLEVMQESQVTVDGSAHQLQAPFFVMATQNPSEFEGTFPLPEAQLDRFMVRLRLGYPGQSHELAMLMGMQGSSVAGKLASDGADVEAVGRDTILHWVQEVEAVHFDRSLAQYIVELVERTRHLDSLQLGASPRAAKALMAMARARAWMKGRDYMLPEDIRHSAVPVLAHRIVLKPEARYRGGTQEETVCELLDSVRLPKVQER